MHQLYMNGLHGKIGYALPIRARGRHTAWWENTPERHVTTQPLFFKRHFARRL